jgi:hypothetical protein
MPYSYHKQGDKYVVTKKDTGKVVGHTKGTKEALKKYLAALHINANEGKSNTMKKSELKEMIQEIIKEVISEQTNTTPKHKIIAQLLGPDFFLSKKPESTWDEKDHDLFNRISKMASETGEVPKIYESTDYMKRRKAMDDYATNKKDAPKKPYKAESGKTDYMKRREADKKANESVDYDTAVAYRITTSGNRDEVMAKVQGLLDNLTTGKSSKFPEVKVTMMASKGNPNDIILKLNGPGAFSMSKDIKARPELKGVKVSTYKPQLTKVS